MDLRAFHPILMILGLGVCLSATGAQPDPPIPPDRSLPEGRPSEPPRSWDHWLDEVRAQRKAWEARRQATKAAIDAHRRLVDPWGAARHEAQAREHQRRRRAFREEVERQRAFFWNSIPWDGPDWGDRPSDSPEDLGPDRGAPGWNNLWYYRGY